jgi:hypothetical protein
VGPFLRLAIGIAKAVGKVHGRDFVHVEAGPCGDLTFIAGERGQPLTKESFGNVFRDACRAAKVPGSAHGVRKIAATRAANHGATVAPVRLPWPPSL